MPKDRIITSIDIGSAKISTLITSISQEAEKDKVNVIGIASVPAKGIRKGQIIDIDEAVSAITQSVEASERMAGATVTNAFISVGGTQISCQNSHGVVAVSEPEGEISAEDVLRVMDAAQAVSLPSSREILHVIPRDFIVDSQEGVKDPLGMTGVRLEVDTHIVTGSSTSLRNLAKCISEVGIKVDQLVFAGLASAEAVLTDTEKELGVILVDIGAGTTNVCVYVEGALSYSFVLPVGGKNVTNDLAIGLRISLDSAEKIKLFLSKEKKKVIIPESEKSRKIGSGDELDFSGLSLTEEIKKVSQKTLTEGIIRPRLLEIFNEIASVIQKNSLAGLTPAGVVITGGGSLTVGITESCRQRLALPVRLGSFSGFSGLTEDLHSPSYSTLSGLILYALKNNNKKSPGIPLFRDFSKITDKIPIKNVLSKIGDLLKAFLP